jgi:succinate-acetate transporter protein
MAVGNTFGATALSSYGGFWISYAIILTPGGFEIINSIATADKATGVTNSIGLYLMVCPTLPPLRNSKINS